MKHICILFLTCLLVLPAGCSASGPSMPAATTAAIATSLATATPAVTAAPTQQATAQPSPEPTAVATLSPTPEPSPDSPAKLGLEDIALVTDEETFQLQSNVQPLLDLLGGGYAETKFPGKLKKGKEKAYDYPDITITAYPSGGKNIMYRIEFTNDAFETPRGIMLGATLDDIKAVYGEGYFEDNGTIIYTLSGKKDDPKSPSVYFEITKNVVTCIGLYNPVDSQ